MTKDEKYIKRCFQLARKAGLAVKSNPLVGSVLVYGDRIIGEGYHAKFGEAHAEVNAINSVKQKNQHLIKDATLYVSLEPCCIINKTPACSDLILKHGISKVVVSTSDPNPRVAGNSFKILEDKGLTIVKNVLLEEGNELIYTFKKNLQNLPSVDLKWAQSNDNFIGKKEAQYWLSNPLSKVYAHKLRAESNGILIGTNTVIIDNPRLNLREYPGKSPLRIVLDRKARIPKSHHIYKDSNKTLIVSQEEMKLEGNKENLVLDFDSSDFLPDLLARLYDLGIFKLLVEGGASLLNSFIQQNLWDRAHIIHTPQNLDSGIKSPNLEGKLLKKLILDDNYIDIVKPLTQ